MYRNTHRAPSESTRPHIGPHHIAYFRVHSCARGDACQSCGRQVMCARRLQGRARGTQAGEVPVAARLSGLIVLGPIRLVQTRDLRHQRIVCRIPTRRQRERPARAQPRRGARRHWSTGTHGFRAGGGARGPAAHPGSDPSTASTQTAAPWRSSAPGSTGSARCQGKCYRCCSRCSGRSSS